MVTMNGVVGAGGARPQHPHHFSQEQQQQEQRTAAAAYISQMPQFQVAQAQAANKADPSGYQQQFIYGIYPSCSWGVSYIALLCTSGVVLCRSTH